MTNGTEHFSLDQLCTLADVSRRTVRYYIQQGMVDRPEGAKRGAHYTRDHLEQLLTIRKWQKAGLSLDRIRELEAKPGEGLEIPLEKSRRPGDVSVRSHVLLHPGVELVIEPSEAGLTPEQVRSFTQQVAALMGTLKKEIKK